MKNSKDGNNIPKRIISQEEVENFLAGTPKVKAEKLVPVYKMVRIVDVPYTENNELLRKALKLKLNLSPKHYGAVKYIHKMKAWSLLLDEKYLLDNAEGKSIISLGYAVKWTLNEIIQNKKCFAAQMNIVTNNPNVNAGLKMAALELKIALASENSDKIRKWTHLYNGIITKNDGSITPTYVESDYEVWDGNNQPRPEE
jgi:hypothetical protein